MKDAAFPTLFALGGVRGTAQELVFESAKDARTTLAAKDAFVLRMSPFDRAARLKTDRDVSAEEYLAFAASAALDWEPREKAAVTSAFQKIHGAVASLPLQKPVYLIKTTGKEEGNAAYTRANAVVLPRSILASGRSELAKVLAHELFHVASRANPSLSRQLYAAIGFDYCGEVAFPKELVARKITNPDAPKNSHCIEVEVGGAKEWVMPILFSRAPSYDPSRGGEFFDYLQLGFLLVERPADGGIPRAKYDERGPRLVPGSRIGGFFEQVGRNTSYVIHPEETLADNFALIALGERHGPSPQILAKIRGVLSKGSESAASPDVDN